MSMVGNTYLLRGEPVEVLARWRTPTDDDPLTYVAPCCGDTVVGLASVIEKRDVWPDHYLGDDTFCGSCGEVWRERAEAGHSAINGWQPGGRPVVRNILLRRADGSLTVRPFRGLRRAEQCPRCARWVRADVGDLVACAQCVDADTAASVAA